MITEQKHCVTCNEKLGKNFGIAKKGWDVLEGSILCPLCWEIHEDIARERERKENVAEKDRRKSTEHKERKHCIVCNKELGILGQWKTEMGWDVLEGSWLCWDCWYERKKPHEVSRRENKSVHYNGEFVTVIEIPIIDTRPAWNKVDELVKNGYSIKGIIEREHWSTSWVILKNAMTSLTRECLHMLESCYYFSDSKSRIDRIERMPPMTLDTLKAKNRELYEALKV